MMRPSSSWGKNGEEGCDYEDILSFLGGVANVTLALLRRLMSEFGLIRVARTLSVKYNLPFTVRKFTAVARIVAVMVAVSRGIRVKLGERVNKGNDLLKKNAAYK